MKKMLFLMIIGGMFLCSCASHQKEYVQHVVICWLKEPGNEQARDQLIEVSRNLAQIPGTISVSAGEVLPSERPVVDNSFDVAIIIAFKDKEAMADYLVHPLHKRAVEETIKPLVERFVVYDFIE